MAAFVDNYIVLKVPQPGLIRTTMSTLHYGSDLVDALIVVPEGLQTDLGSIPRVLQGIFPKDGKAIFAYILHDYLYTAGMYPRDTTDDILEEAMEALGVDWITRVLVRSGLRIGGWVSWDKHRKNDRIKEVE